MNTTDELRQAKELLSDERRWNRGGSLAANVNGYRANVNGPTAVRWCAIGACLRVQGMHRNLQMSLKDQPAVQALAVANGFGFWGEIPTWNDEVATHADLIAAFDRALLFVAAQETVEKENVGELVAA